MIITTERCGQHGHPEVTLVFRERRPVPVERLLVSFFERRVESGTRFFPGQTVQVGSALFRLCERADGTLGVEERDASGWVESCDSSLMNVWLQKEIAASLGLRDEIVFPRGDQLVFVCDWAYEAERWLFARSQPRNADDSGWFIGCMDISHAHHEPSAILADDIFHVSQRLPFAAQFLALRPGCDVHVELDGKRLRPRVFVDGDRRLPMKGSYLAALAAL